MNTKITLKIINLLLKYMLKCVMHTYMYDIYIVVIYIHDNDIHINGISLPIIQ